MSSSVEGEIAFAADMREFKAPDINELQDLRFKQQPGEREPLAIGVLLSGSGTNLQALIDAIEAGELNAQIKLVVSSRPSAYGLKRAEAAGQTRYTVFIYRCIKTFCKLSMLLIIKSKNMDEYSSRESSIDPKMNERVITTKL